MLKGLRPEKYRERVEVRGSLANLDLSRLQDDLLARIAAGEHPLSVLASFAEGVPQLGPGDPAAGEPGE
ncbi:MAG: hypothetical protein GTO22_03220 [Gemmatimonadales bacterium]|nr:hypothetical protein [Gemmatimonadales bacterium]